ncbi:MAG: 50S ribosomal protein L24 [Verrucomicrobiota bacterium]|jgi:large subunit ribosomal protein L24|nr:50S ribosomal protein L24 [Verrucomicrobiota bacterium]
MATKFHVKKGDDVVVITGSAKGRRGKVAEVVTSRQAVILEGTDERSKEQDDRRRLVKPMLHYVRKNQQNPNGSLLWLESPIHVSNVMKAEKYDARKANQR